MKTKLLLLIGLFACQTLFAQTTAGISVQGIARNAEKSALVDELLTFKFEIKNGATTYYTETVDIRTDPYGVFSHIIGTGTPSGGKNFNEIPFGQFHMDLLITANGTPISEGPFQYAPYAKSAENGVPTGTIVAFAGKKANVPKGWALCDGSDFGDIEDSGNLKALLGSSAVPDLRGMFLRGAGTNQDAAFVKNVGPDLNVFQEDGFKTHDIDASAEGVGNHQHTFSIDWGSPGTVTGGYMIRVDGTSAPANGSDAVATHGGGAHTHNITASPVGGGDETRPVNYGVNYIIKL